MVLAVEEEALDFLPREGADLRAGGHVTGNWGGSATSVTSDSKHPQQAAQFIAWLNHETAGTDLLVTDGNVYPASLAAESGSALSTPAFVAGQSDFYTLAKTYSTQAATPVWGPDVNVAYTEFQTAFGSAASSKGSFLSPLTAVQSTVVNDMKKSGFTVAAG